METPLVDQLDKELTAPVAEDFDTPPGARWDQACMIGQQIRSRLAYEQVELRIVSRIFHQQNDLYSEAVTLIVRSTGEPLTGQAVVIATQLSAESGGTVTVGDNEVRISWPLASG